MVLNELMQFFIMPEDQYIELFDIESGKTIFAGAYDECPDDYDWLEIRSIDNLTKTTDILIINVEL